MYTGPRPLYKCGVHCGVKLIGAGPRAVVKAEPRAVVKAEGRIGKVMREVGLEPT